MGLLDKILVMNSYLYDATSGPSNSRPGQLEERPGQYQFLCLGKSPDLAGPPQSILAPTALRTFFWDLGSFAICPTTPTHLPLRVPKLPLLLRSHRNVDACQATSWTFHSSPWLGGSKKAKWAGCLTVWVPNAHWNEWSSLLDFSNNHEEKQKMKQKKYLLIHMIPFEKQLFLKVA